MTIRKILIITIFLITIVYTSLLFFHDDNPIAENGVLDLKEWDFKEDGTVFLEGEWELFYGKLLSDKDINKRGLKGEIVKIPSLWKQNGYNNTGYATYKLDVLVDTNNLPDLAVRVPYEASSYMLYVNNKPVLYNGIVGTTKDKSIPEYFPKYNYINVYQNKLTFVMHISNFHNNRGGFIENIRIGTKKDIYSKFENESRSELLISSIIFLIGLYLLITYYITIRDKSMLVFSWICFTVTLRNIVIHNKIILQYFNNISWSYMFRIEYITSILATILFIYFCYHYFSVKKYKLIRKVYTSIGIISIFIILFTKPIIFTKGLIGMYIYVLLGFVYCAIIIFDAYKKRNEKLVWFSYSVFIVLIAVINDIINDAFGLSYYILVPHAMMIAASIQVIFFTNTLYKMVNRSQKLAEENKKISIKLANLNENLEKMVKLRTLELEEMLKLDPMTKLYNHKYIIQVVHKEIQESDFKGDKLCLCLLDVDDFKRINDEYGHLKGDEVLNKVSNILMTYDDRITAGRYGGEEFLLIISNVNIKKAFELCNNIRMEIDRFKFSDKSLRVTISGGIVEYSGRETVEQLVGMADKLLYKAKDEGKNKICI